QAGGSIEPAFEDHTFAQAMCFSGQNHEHRLGDLLGMGGIAGVPKGHGIDPVNMPGHQHGKSRLRVALDVFTQQRDVIPILHLPVNAAERDKRTAFFAVFATAPEARHRTSRIPEPTGNSRSNSATLLICPGSTNSGAISLNGCNTNLRSCARGCGNTRRSVLRRSSPNAIKSKSNGRASFNTCFGLRPNTFSNSCNFPSSDSGVSPARGFRATTAFTNGGDPGGQSTGLVSQSDDAFTGSSDRSPNRAIARRMAPWGFPRFAPNAMMATSSFTSFGPKYSLIFSFIIKKLYSFLSNVERKAGRTPYEVVKI